MSVRREEGNPPSRVFIHSTTLHGRERYEPGIYWIDSGLAKYFVENGWATYADKGFVVKAPEIAAPSKKSWIRRLFGG